MYTLMPFHLLLNIAVFTAAYAWLVRPHAARIGLERLLLICLMLQSLRHLGLMFLATGAVGSGLPPQFAWPAALGDLTAAVLSFAAAWRLQARARDALTWAWLATGVGLADFVSSISLANYWGAVPHLQAAYWIPAFWVPMLIVAHGIAMDTLLSAKRASLRAQEAA